MFSAWAKICNYIRFINKINFSRKHENIFGLNFIDITEKKMLFTLACSLNREEKWSHKTNEFQVFHGQRTKETTRKNKTYKETYNHNLKLTTEISDIRTQKRGFGESKLTSYDDRRRSRRKQRASFLKYLCE